MPDGIRYRFYFKGKSYLIPKDYIDNEHPGGADEIMPYVGKEMTEAFEDADHSLDAVELLGEWLEEEYDASIPSDLTEAVSREEQDTKAVDTAPQISTPETAVLPEAPKLAQTLSTTPTITVRRSVSEPSKRRSYISSVVPAAAAVVVVTSIAVFYVRFTRR
ncbi:hypothetical protein JKF63_03848 [Porcisia hertigi]|uniref:Cytochrome b5 heme-binding domain-containing protein n=1 Tax=Porcisia hertigi TaxID=2761500 RepID=A0A836IC59_9TRYP|nr:hypothetical protein JKF63_03848 [Porcisia hertigi]